LAFASSAWAESIQGSYLEARSVPAAACGEAERCAGQSCRVVLAWQIRRGEYDGQKLDGQTIVAVVTAAPAPAGGELGQTKTVFVVDNRTTLSQQRALVQLAKDLAPAVIHDAGQTFRSNPDVRIAEGCGCGAAVVDCHLAKVRTRRLADTDQAPTCDGKAAKPLGDVFSNVQAIVTEYSCEGEPAASTADAVSAFVGSFSR
jgi:hypothetical protein